MELLKGGLAGLTLLTVAGCKEPRQEARVEEAPIDPSIPRYRETGRFDAGFRWARGIAASAGALYLAGDMSVKRFVGGKADTVQEMNDAVQAVAVGEDGRVFAATSDRVLPVDGGPWESLGPRARIVSLAAAGGLVYAADAGNRAVVVYDRGGRLVRRIEGFIVPSPYFGVAAAPDGDVWISNPGRHQVERYSPEGERLTQVGSQGQEIGAFCGCCNPGPIALAGNGNLVTSEKGIPRVKVLSPEGRLQALVSTDFNVQAAGLDVAVDGQRIYVLDPWEGAVRAFEPA
ncbi:MAG TPA: hypothetical protein VGE01_00610 [Fimbriimonas sp.]